MNQTFPSSCEIEDYTMGRQIRFTIRLQLRSQRRSHRLFYIVRRKPFALKQTEYSVRRNYTCNTGLGLKITSFLK